MASDKITADMVETSEFPHLTVKYEVQAVPTTIINGKHNVLGAQPENELLQALLQASGK